MRKGASDGHVSPLIPLKTHAFSLLCYLLCLLGLCVYLSLFLLCPGYFVIVFALACLIACHLVYCTLSVAVCLSALSLSLPQSLPLFLSLCLSGLIDILGLTRAQEHAGCGHGTQTRCAAVALRPPDLMRR